MSEITKSKADSIWTQELLPSHLPWIIFLVFQSHFLLKTKDPVFKKNKKGNKQPPLPPQKFPSSPPNKKIKKKIQVGTFNPKSFLHLSKKKSKKNLKVGITWRFVPPLLLDLWSIAYVSWNGPTKVVPLLQGHWPCWCWWENWPTCWLTDTWWRCLKQLGMEQQTSVFFWKKVLETWKT